MEADRRIEAAMAGSYFFLPANYPYEYFPMPALNYIEDNFRKDFSVLILAEITGISQQYLCRIFQYGIQKI